MRDVEAIADIVVTTMKAAMAPVLERLATMEARWANLADVRDRVIVLETKAAVPATVPEIPTPVDLSPFAERIAVAEKTLAGLPERMALEMKAAQAAIPPVSVPVVDLGPITQRQDAVEAAMAAAVNLGDRCIDMAKDISRLTERLAVVETRGAISGPPGPAGKDGENGKDGQDGIVLDDLGITQENDRTLIVRARVGNAVKTIGTLTVPVEIYRGVWVEGKTYDCGDGVTWGGSEWHCNDTTTSKPGEGSKAWTLKVKRGRDGKDGRDAVALPVVKVG